MPLVQFSKVAEPSPRPDDDGWIARHYAQVEAAKTSDFSIAFLGDSITEGWSGGDVDAWKDILVPMGAAQFGLGGDGVQHVLWRLDHGLLQPLTKACLYVLMIGTNNIWNVVDDYIINGTTQIVDRLKANQPNAAVLIVGILPRMDNIQSNWAMPTIKHVNLAVSKLDNGGPIRFIDIADRYWDGRDLVSTDLMPDGLHLSPLGYKIYAEAIRGPIEELLALGGE